MSAQLKLMTFNMRTQTTSDGENQFLNRKEFIADKLNEVKPDVIGCQEMQPIMMSWLVSAMDDYYVVGGGRGANFDNEAVCIAYRKDRFALYNCETFWLSPTPSVPGSRYSGDQSGCPRVCTWVMLKPLDGGKPFRFYNVHTDHVGDYARVLACNQVLQKISENNNIMKLPTFVTGDFNDRPDSMSIKTMKTCPGIPRVDLTEASGQTFHAYGKRNDSTCKIDYIFADAGTKCLDMQVLTDKRGELYLSDHYPLMATVELD